ncbi:LytR/AlgR family response regulator transcription factor [Dyadobacter frigoris]|uniref:Response regulator transcription factor n=1 Tax=Dyadobacter frigoris TaxID=2576211 RepID=A0A4U6D883_9BACT|nr:LytTR family DNA-binding domain-containing protein [Dyadobacter frigoris]TKT93700.1 response regulator transcription factor [Dyadobacter frigoris]GLU51091.1 DNA-binding response regulator [Dyadobacter frigoris]
MINCLIVDDAPVARDILMEYCKLLPILHVSGTCLDAFEAREKIQKEPVDLLFLDINMPILTGIDLMKTLKHPPQVIFTTAYKEFATDAFDLGACDYLVKPFSLERFIIAIDRAAERIGRLNINTESKSEVPRNNHLLIRSEGVINKLNYDQILFLEASRNNTKVVTPEVTFLSTIPLSSIEKLLPLKLFSRVHRSFIVNRSKITSLQGNRIFINKSEIPVGNNYKSSLFEIIGIKTK